MRVALLLLLATVLARPQSPLEEVKADSDLGRRADKAITLAETELDAARDAYVNNDIRSGDSHLDIMAKALDEAAAALEQTHKSKGYKKAEVRVAHLQRRLNGLLDIIGLGDRGWADQTSRHVADIRDKLLAGAMRK